jgi:hypothetical protein
MSTNVKRLLLYAIVGACLGCSNSARPPPERPKAADIRPPEHFRPSRKAALSFCEKTTVEAYRQIGARNPKWDDNAEVALRLWAYQICDEGSVASGPEFKVMRASTAQALKDGCDDPLIMYIAIRSDRISENLLVREPHAEFYARIINGLAQHPYPPMRQVLIFTRGAEAIGNIGETQLTPELKRKEMEWLAKAVDKIPEMDLGGIDRYEFYAGIDHLLEGYRSATGDRKQGYDRIAAALDKNSSKKGIIPLQVKGSFYVDWAWDARGIRHADKVTESGWKFFSERLGIAREALEDAWSQDSTDPAVCRTMINVAAGECARDEMEVWFERGKKINPAYYELYATKLNFIQPQWGGSDEEMLALGRACVKEGLWADTIPFIVVGAHDWIARRKSGDPSDHFTEAGVWEEIELVYQEYLSKFPNQFGMKSGYAYRAGLAHKWNLANRLLDELNTNVVATGFGGMGKLMSHRQEIRQHRNSQ